MINKKTYLLIFIVLLAPSLHAATFSSYLATKKGNDALKNKQIQEALTHYSRALENQDNEADLLFNIGNAHYENQDFEAANKSYLAAKNKGSQHLDMIHHNLGNTAFQQKNYQKAVNYYINALKQNPQSEHTQKNLELALGYLKQQQQNQEQQQQNQEQQQQNQEQQQQNQEQQQQQNQEQQQQNQEQQQNANASQNEPLSNQEQNNEEIKKQQIKNFLSTFDEKEKQALEKYHQKPQYEEVDIDW